MAIAYRARPSAGRAANLGLALAGAVLFHVTHVLLTPFGGRIHAAAFC